MPQVDRLEAVGWNTWEYDFAHAVVHLPSRVRLHIGLYNPQTGEHVERVGWKSGGVRLGPHAVDGRYCQIGLDTRGTTISIEFAAAGDALACRITPTTPGSNLLLVEAAGAWGTEVNARRDGDVLRAGDDWTFQVNRVPAATPEPLRDRAILAFKPDAPLVIACGTDEPVTLIERQRDDYAATRLRSAGWLGDGAQALVDVIHWNTLYVPERDQICTPHSRDWVRGWGGYCLFAWDTFFTALLAGWESPALAKHNVLAMLGEATEAGFVPNFGSQRGKSEDRSQPPVGALCTLRLYYASALYEENRDRSLLEAAYPALLRWHRWWFTARDGNGDGLLEWGTNPLPDDVPAWNAHNKQGALYESGLDNSPMYDDAAFNPETHTLELNDVGLNALYAADAQALATMARILGHEEDAADLHAEHERLGQRIEGRMWNDALGIYQNTDWNGDFSPRLSPTLFYPMLARAALGWRAGRMVEEHLLNEDEFWGEWVLPSIARNDPAYPEQDYWRGRVWPPMNWLVHQGLRLYGWEDTAKELAVRSLKLHRSEWHERRHAHENYNADTGAGCDVVHSDPLYTWAGLLPMMALQQLVDVQENGWRFGTWALEEPASLRGVRVAEGTLDVVRDDDSLRVTLNDRLVLHVTGSAIITEFRRGIDKLDFVCIVPISRMARITVGELPAATPVQVAIETWQRRRTSSADGTLRFDVARTAPISIRWQTPAANESAVP